MWNRTASSVTLVCFLLPLSVTCLLTSRGRHRILARQRRAASRWSQPVYTPAGYSPPASPSSYNPSASPYYTSDPRQQNLQQQQAAQQASLYSNRAVSSPYVGQYSSYPNNAATFQQYVAPTKNTAYSGTGTSQPYNRYQTVNPGGALSSNGNPAFPKANSGYTSPQVNPPYSYSGYPQSGMYQPGYNMPNSASGYPSAMYVQKNGPQPGPQAMNAYPSIQSSFAKNQYAQPGSQQYVQQNYGLYQDPLRTPMQYNFNGFDPYAQQGNTNGQQQQQQPSSQGGYTQLQGAGRAAVPVSQPLVTPSPQQKAQQYELKEFCLKPDREPKCKKNAFLMCDYQDNYPADAASEFYAYYKSRITAMTTDYDYTSSDQFDTGFATQQNKLIDFVHDIFDDNEYGNLPGVPPQKKGLCIGVSDIVQPGWARTSHGKYYVVMNSNNIKQTVRAEVCKNVGKGCQTVPKCYKSECRQRYRFDTLLVLDPCDPKRAPMLELFKIPDGCECIVVVDEPDIVSDNAATVTAGPTKQRNLMPTVSPLTPSPRSADFSATSTRSTTNVVLTTTKEITTTTASTTSLPPSTNATTTSTTTVTTSSSTPTSTVKQSLILSPR